MTSVDPEKGIPLHEEDKPPVLVHVTAPANLPAGYTFEAQLNGDPERTFTVEVPEDGVKEGQVFLTPLPDTLDGPRLNVPTGNWKDGLFGCFSLGICHPTLWCAICCPQILMGQIMKRLELTYLGTPGPVAGTKFTFKVVITLVICYIIYSTALEFAAAPYPVDAVPLYITIMSVVGSVLFSLWAIYSMCRTRETIRARYSIKEEHCKGCEDLCCSFWCTCCVVAQMSRHTGEYENYKATCCTETGHPAGTPLAV
eukprot:CAMPEP_0194027990 /NCGR_PEP_ID=MMETSP0009_2-20130614/2022_1 /TAXON_ID=210454 /ORGANISM="Grammatophora oceanica, Strain CCMP 410" /LENGTH=254 /DNA_ID=CAMNT_0038667215 /DNA_START=47 /DNA_END=811 /DNA_ORIENTATION=-